MPSPSSGGKGTNRNDKPLNRGRIARAKNYLKDETTGAEFKAPFLFEPGRRDRSPRISRGGANMRDGGWIPMDKHLSRYLPKTRKYTKIEAAFSVQLDIDRDADVSVQGYAELWDWNRGTVQRFLKGHGWQVVYQSNTTKIKNQRGKLRPIPGFNEMVISERKSGVKNKNRHIRFIDNRNLQTETDIKTKNGHINGHKTDIKENQNGHINLNNNSGLQTETDISKNQTGHKTDISENTTIETSRKLRKKNNNNPPRPPHDPAETGTPETASQGSASVAVAVDAEIIELNEKLNARRAEYAQSKATAKRSAAPVGESDFYEFTCRNGEPGFYRASEIAEAFPGLDLKTIKTELVYNARRYANNPKQRPADLRALRIAIGIIFDRLERLAIKKTNAEKGAS